MEPTTLDIQEESIVRYQQTLDSTNLLAQYENFLNKFEELFTYDAIDLGSYSIRCFLSCYISDKSTRRNLRRGRYHNKETVDAAQKVVQYLKFKLRKHSKKEIHHELVIPFLQTAQTYKQVGARFEKYLYVVYKYNLKKHLDSLQLDMMDSQNVVYMNAWTETEWEEEEVKNELIIEFDDDLQLNDPRWIHGDKSTEPFLSLHSHERYILAKYYYEDYTDKEIARMLPYNPKSIHRIRMRLKKKFHEQHTKGELKWIRL